MRANESIWYRDMIYYVNLTKLRYDKAIRETTSGKRITRLSDDPSGAAFALGLKSRTNQLEQFERNINTAEAYLSATESALNQITTVLYSAVTKVEEGASETQGPEDRRLIADEFSQMKKQLLTLANTRVMGRYLFSGTAIDTQPFTESGTTVTYNGDSGTIDAQIAFAVRVTTNLPGDEVFVNTVDVFQLFQDIIDHLNSDDTAALQNDVERLGEAINHIQHELGKVGNRRRQLNIVKQNIHDFTNSLKEKISSIEDADMSEAISNLMKEETALRVVLQAGSRIQRVTLFDYLG